MPRTVTREPLTRDVVRRWLRDLVDGASSRKEAADRAAPWITEREREVEDPVVWDALIELSGADLRVSPSRYVHGQADFQDWLDSFERAAGGDEGA